LNTLSGYTCLDCPSGYVNVDPYDCLATTSCNDDPCDPLQQCFNVTNGGFKCGRCPNGYTLNTLEACIDIDECLEGTHLCQTPRFCKNTEGSYECSECPLGLEPDSPYTCAKVNSVVYAISGFPGSASATVAVFILMLIAIGISVILLSIVSALNCRKSD